MRLNPLLWSSRHKEEEEVNIHFFILSSDNILSHTQLAEWAVLGKTLGTNSSKAGSFVVLDSWHPVDLTHCVTLLLIYDNGIQSFIVESARWMLQVYGTEYVLPRHTPSSKVGTAFWCSRLMRGWRRKRLHYSSFLKGVDCEHSLLLPCVRIALLFL